MVLDCFLLLLEIEINTIEDCIGESCLSNKVGREGVSGNGNPFGEDERHNNEIGLWKNGKKRNRLVQNKLGCSNLSHSYISINKC